MKTPIPKEVKDTAKQGLLWRKQLGRGGTAVGVATAKYLLANTEASENKLKHLANFFSKYTCPPSCDGAISNDEIAWNMWGGSAALSWVTESLTRLGKEKDATIDCETLSEEDNALSDLPLEILDGSGYSLYLSRESLSVNEIPVPDNLPKEIGGQPVTYLWKDIIRDGRWEKPIKIKNEYQLQIIEVTPERRKQFEDSYRKFTGNGNKVYIPVDHSTSASDNRGYVVGVLNKDDRMYGLLQLIGEDAAKEGARNDVSCFIRKEYTDTNGVSYNDVIEHVSLTPIPVISGLGKPELAQNLSIYVLSRGNNMADILLKFSPEQLAKLQKLIPGAEKLSNDEISASVISHLETIAAEDEKEVGKENVTSLSRSEIVTTAFERRENLRKLPAQVEELKKQNLELSRKIPTPLPDEVSRSLIDAARIKLDTCIARGSLDKATAEVLFNRIVADDKGKPHTYYLSRASAPDDKSSCLAISILEILAGNKPVSPDVTTGIQQLSRETEEDKKKKKESEEERSAKTLRERMSKVASGKASSVKITD